MTARTLAASIITLRSAREVPSLLQEIAQLRATLATSSGISALLEISPSTAAALVESGMVDTLRTHLAREGIHLNGIQPPTTGDTHDDVENEARLHLQDGRGARWLAHTNVLAILLARLRGHAAGWASVGTVPGDLEDLVREVGGLAAAAEHVIRHAAVLHWLQRDTGQMLTLALPMTLLGSGDDVTRAFHEAIVSARMQELFVQWTGCAREDAAAAIRRHVGVSVDTSKDALRALPALLDAGIAVPRVMLGKSAPSDELLGLAVKRGLRDALVVDSGHEALAWLRARARSVESAA